MDSSQISPETSAALQNLSAKDTQELNQFVLGESQKAQIQNSMFVPVRFSAFSLVNLASSD
jgi:hypothetical protein